VPDRILLRLVGEGQEDEGGVFDPDEIAVMATAFDQLLLDLRLAQRDDPLVTMIAKRVIELVRNGVRDPEQVRREVVAAYRSSS
jgi:hypothetical protein